MCLKKFRRCLFVPLSFLSFLVWPLVFQVRVACGPRCRGHAHICMFQSYNHEPGDNNRLGSFSALSLSVKIMCFIFGTSFVALRCTFLEGLDRASILVTKQH